MFKIESGKSKSLEELACDFYHMLNPKDLAGNYIKKSLTEKIKKQLGKECDSKQIFFYNYLIKNDSELLKDIIIGSPKKLLLIKNKFDKLVLQGSIPKFYTDNKSSDFGKEILKLFNYKGYRKGSIFRRLGIELDINICPYCNYAHNMTIIKNKVLMHLFVFDHFIPNVICPYFSLSFFNLIPCCQNCNSVLKGSIDSSSISEYGHPYLDNLHSFFNFSINKPVLDDNLDSFSIVIIYKATDPIDKTKSENNNNLFKILERYTTFKDEILRLNQLKQVYNEKYKNDLLNTKILGKIFSNREEVIKHIAYIVDIPSDEKTAIRKEKGKFKLDIAREFKILD